MQIMNTQYNAKKIINTETKSFLATSIYEQNIDKILIVYRIFFNF